MHARPLSYYVSWWLIDRCKKFEVKKLINGWILVQEERRDQSYLICICGCSGSRNCRYSCHRADKKNDKFWFLMDVRENGGRGHHQFSWREIFESCGHRNGCAGVVSAHTKKQNLKGSYRESMCRLGSLYSPCMQAEQFTIAWPSYPNTPSQLVLGYMPQIFLWWHRKESRMGLSCHTCKLKVINYGKHWIFSRAKVLFGTKFENSRTLWIIKLGDLQRYRIQFHSKDWWGGAKRVF